MSEAPNFLQRPSPRRLPWPMTLSHARPQKQRREQFTLCPWWTTAKSIRSRLALLVGLVLPARAGPVLLLGEFLGEFGDAGFADNGIVNFSAVATLVAHTHPARFVGLRHRFATERAMEDFALFLELLFLFFVRFAFGASFILQSFVAATRFPPAFIIVEDQAVEDTISNAAAPLRWILRPPLEFIDHPLRRFPFPRLRLNGSW